MVGLAEEERIHKSKSQGGDLFEELEKEEASESSASEEEPAEESDGGLEKEHLVPLKSPKKHKAKKRASAKKKEEFTGDDETEISGAGLHRAEEEKPELTVSEHQKKTVNDEDTEIVKPKRQKWKDAEVSGFKEEKEETDIYRPITGEKKFTIHVEGDLDRREETDIYTPKKKERASWAKEVKIEAEDEEKAQEEESAEEPAEKEKEQEIDEGDGELEKEDGTKEEDVVDEYEFDDDFDLELEGEGISTEGIRKKIIERAEKESVRVSETSVPLKFLEDGDNVLMGRKKSVHSKYGMQGALYVGKVGEEEQKDKSVFLDSLNPHVVFVCGARGSGKSYVLGVIAEELAKKNNNVGIVVIDPIGVFWSMRFPNREKKEIDAMGEWGLSPEGLNNLKVFIPEGMAKETPKNTYDATFSIQPSLLTSEDWCLTFGIDRFSPTGLLLEKAVKKVESGYKTTQSETQKSITLKPKGKKYGIDDIVNCLEHDADINSREKGFKQDSVRALVSRFEAAKGWGVFSNNGTPLAEISREGQLTVMDTSFLEDNVTALVIGILARRLLAARKIVTRKEASVKFKDKDMDQMMELEVPATWLFIDEAHTLIPSGNVRTPATAGLIEYVKQGRRPGLSLVFATQQPSAIDTKVLSQLDVIMSHKLVFDDDIKAIYKRTPTIIPSKYRKATFIKTLPVGVALTGDRAEETSRAFIMRIRPRMSQHEGRDAVTMENTKEMNPKEAQELALSMALSKIKSEGLIELDKVKALVDTLNTKYKSKIAIEELLKALEKNGCKIDKNAGTIATKDYRPEEKAQEIQAESIAQAVEESAEVVEREARKSAAGESGEQTELVAIPAGITEQHARRIFDSFRKKKTLGLFGSEERIGSMQLKHRTIWKVMFNEYNLRKEFVKNECYIDSVSGEFLHFNGKEFIESKGAKMLYDLDDDEIAVALEIATKKKVSEGSEAKFKRIAEKLAGKGLIKIKEEKGVKKFVIDEQAFDLPPSPSHELLASVGKMRLVTVESLGKEREVFGRESALKLVQKLWPSIIVKRIEEVQRPFFEAVFEAADGAKKAIRIDALSGKRV